MLSTTDNSYSSPLPKPAAGGLLDDPSGTASTQPITKPPATPSTQPLPLGPASSAPAPAPPPPATPDPLAFGPAGAAGAPAGSDAPPIPPPPPPPDPTGGVGDMPPIASPPPPPTDPNGMLSAGQGINETNPRGGTGGSGGAPLGGSGGVPPGAGQAQLPIDNSSIGLLGGGPFPTTDMIKAEGQGEGAPQGGVGTGGNGLAVPVPAQTTPIPTDANGMPSYTTTPTTPDNSLLNSTITPGSATDRYAIAQKEYNDWVAQSDPQFQASLRDSNRYAAAAGRIGSGQATNSIGDIQTQRENAMRTSRDSFLGNALTGSIDDAYKNIGVAQQQQQFQAGQQQTGFGQNVELQQLANSEQGQQFSQMMQSLGFNATQIQQAFDNAYRVQQLSNSQDSQSFYQALEQEIQGSQGDPAQILAWISGQYARGGG